MKSCEDHIASFGNDSWTSDDTDALRDTQSAVSNILVLHSTPVKPKVVNRDELDNAFTKARNKLFHNDVDGKIGVEMKLIYFFSVFIFFK